MELPTELQFETLLNLSFDEIINYCSVNQAARQLCQSEPFWQLKATHDFGYRLPINAKLNPAQRYLQLIAILNNADINQAIIEGDTRLVKALFKLGYGINDIAWETNLIALEKGYYQIIEVIENLSAREDFQELINSAGMVGIEDEKFELIPVLDSFVPLDYLSLISHLIATYGVSDFRVLDSLIVQGKERRPNLVQEIIEGQFDQPMADPAVVQYLLTNYQPELNMRPLIRKILSESQNGQLLLPYI